MQSIVGKIQGALERRRARSDDPLRSTALQVLGLGFICWAFYSWVPQVGYAAIGVSLFLIEYLMRPERR